MEIVSQIVQQLHAGVITLLAFAPIWLILLNPVTNKEILLVRASMVREAIVSR